MIKKHPATRRNHNESDEENKEPKMSVMFLCGEHRQVSLCVLEESHLTMVSFKTGRGVVGALV